MFKKYKLSFYISLLFISLLSQINTERIEARIKVNAKK